jgi:ADP-ribose pyrophosphatase YjhB (NUDIX family)
MEGLTPIKFTCRCYAFILNAHREVLVMKEFWSGTHLNKLPGGGQELGEGMHQCLNRELQEEFAKHQSCTWRHLFTPEHAFVSKFRPDEQLILNYFVANEEAKTEAWELIAGDANLLGMEWLPLLPENTLWFTLEADQLAFKALLDHLG